MTKKDKQVVTRVMLGLAVAQIAIMAAAPHAHALIAPAVGDFGYDLYTFTVDKVLKGPLGFIGGVSAMAYGALQAVKGDMILAAPSFIGGVAFMKADTLVTSLGAVV